MKKLTAAKGRLAVFASSPSVCANFCASAKSSACATWWADGPRWPMGYNPSYKWINLTYPIYNWGYNPLTKCDEPPSRTSGIPVLHSFTAFFVINFTILEVTKSMNSHGSVVINHHQSCVVKMMKESAIIRTHICHITFLSTSHLIITHEKSPSNSTILNSLDQNPHQKCVYSHFIVSYTYLSYLSLYYIYISI